MLRSIDTVSDLLRETAAHLITPAFRATTAAEEKSPGEWVTDVDRGVEEALAPALRSLAPGSRVVGEEAVHLNPSLLDDLDDGWTWLVDPLDGTRNFIEGREEFGMMIALLRNGEPVVSWIHAPASGRMAVAEAGSGAFIDGSRVTMESSPGAAHAPGMIYTRFLPPHVACATTRECVPPTGAASADYPEVVQGSLSFVFYWRALAWDHAAGTLLVTEAGGAAAHLDGSPYRPQGAMPGLLVARSADDWRAIRATIGC